MTGRAASGVLIGRLDELILQDVYALGEDLDGRPGHLILVHVRGMGSKSDAPGYPLNEPTQYLH